MENLISKTLSRCGYGYLEPTEENLTQVFMDYVDNGVFPNLSVEEAETEIEDGMITVEIMCKNLLKVR